jgi:hypothetical protein
LDVAIAEQQVGPAGVPVTRGLALLPLAEELPSQVQVLQVKGQVKIHPTLSRRSVVGVGGTVEIFQAPQSKLRRSWMFVYAGDGHYLEHATHDPMVEETRWPTGHFFALSLKSQSLFPLTLADLAGRKKEHDARALKRQSVAILRQGA